MEIANTYDWEDLPLEIAAKIREHIELYDDYEAFSEVCSSWRLAIKQFPAQYINRKHTQFPWLMLADPDDSSYRRFYSLTKCLFLNIDLLPFFSPPQTTRYFSSRGWLISLTKNISKSTQERVYFNITIFNPFSNNETIHAPLFDLIGQEVAELTDESDDLLSAYFGKIAVSTCPNNAKDGDDFVVAVTFGDDRMVAYWRLGHGDTWDVAYSPPFDNVHQELSFFRGELYATQYYDGYKHRLIAFGDLKDHKNSPRPRVVADLEIPANMRGSDFDNYYLVESKSDQSDQAHTSSLLVIHRCVLFESLGDDDDQYHYHTASFNAFKMNFDNGKVEPVKSLGNQAIFVGQNTAFAVCANADYDRGCKADCIYYTDDSREIYYENQGGGSDMGIYSLPHGNTIPFYEGPSRFSVINPPIWIEFPGA